MKKTNFAKILTIVLVCAALIGAVVGINASAASDEKSIEIVSNNVWYGETLQLVYAVKCDSDVVVTIYSDEDCTVEWSETAPIDVENTTINGVENCKVYGALKGVPVQNINTNLWAKAVDTVTGDVVVQRYSVLEYLFERLNVSENVEENQIAMYEAHLAYALAAEDVLYDNPPSGTAKARPEGTNPVAGYYYVKVTNGTIDGTYSAGMYEKGSQPFANIAHNLVDAIEKNIAYNITVNEGSETAYSLEDIQEFKITGNTFVNIVETEGEVVTEPTTVSVSIADYADDNSWSNGTKYSPIKMDDYITVEVVGDGTNTGKYYETGENWRIYQNENPSIVVSAVEGTTILSVKITYSINNSGTLTLNGESITSGSTVEVNAESITFGVGNTGTATNGQVRITAIEVVYQ